MNTRDSSIDVDMLCNRMSGTCVDYDEFQELEECLKMQYLDLDATSERYTRYLNGISDWTMNGVSYEHIKEMIILFLNSTVRQQKIIYKKQIDALLYHLLK